MRKRLQEVKNRLDIEVKARNTQSEITEEKLDPLYVAQRYQDEWVALICALFAYGNVKAIVGFLETLDFSLLDKDESAIKKQLKNHYYRFQNSEDVTALFIALARLKKMSSLQALFKEGYSTNASVLEGLNTLIRAIVSSYPYESLGYRFLVGKPVVKTKGNSCMKRWFLFLRWMVRDDSIDMGLWEGVDTADLIMPLDTHTFNVSHKLGLLKRKTYDLEAALELTNTFRLFDAYDPIKYDFALYRLGQEKMV